MKRRIFLLGSTALVSACATGTTVNLAQAATQAQAVTGALEQVDVQLGNLNLLTPSTSSAIGIALSGLQVALTNIQNDTAATSAQSDVIKFEGYANDIIDAAAAIPLIPPPISTVLQAAAILLPIIEAAVNPLVSTTKPKAVRTIPGATPMDAASALVIVQAAAKGGFPGLKAASVKSVRKAENHMITTEEMASPTHVLPTSI